VSPNPLVATATDVVEALLDLVVPRVCAGCGEPRQLLCPGCRAALDRPAQRTVPRPSPAGFPPTWTVTAYDGAVREALLAHKEHGRLGLAGPLGDGLARSVSAAVETRHRGSGWPPVVLVPVPSSAAATRARGHDPMLRIARRAACVLRASGRPTTVLPALAVGRTVSDQAGLGAVARAHNLAGAHRIRPRALARLQGGATVVLVDDLVTTGASLAEASRALHEVGLPPLAAAVVAATARRGPLDRPGPTG
jgi:predicted amidophosphoribosyltransferase